MRVQLLILLTTFACSAAKFGTNDGYDREGGWRAMCWKVEPEAPFPVPSFDNVDELQSPLIKNSTVELLDECYEGTGMNVTLVENPGVKGKDAILYSGSEVTFRFDMTLDPSQLEEDLVLLPGHPLLARIKLCDASRTGFCVPFKTDKNEETVVAKEASVSGEIELTIAEKKQKGIESSIKATSPFLMMEMDEGTQNDDSPTFNISASVKVTIPNIWGSYFVIGHTVLFLGKNTTEGMIGTMELDISNTVEPRIYTIKEPPVLLEPTSGYLIGISLLLGAAGLFEMALLIGLISCRNNMVVKLSQPTFLILLVFCSMIATVSCIFYIPLNDLFCNLWAPLILIPASTIASILIARGWRTYVLLSSALRLSLIASKRRVCEERFMTALTFLASWQEVLEEKSIRRFQKRPSKRRSLASSQQAIRKEVKDHYVLQLVVVLIIPQIIIQSIAWSLYPSQLEILEGESFSRVTCQSSQWWPILLSIIIVTILFLMAVVVAYICRDLPSLFNEKRQIFKASWINFMVLVFAGTTIGLTDFATTSPNSRAFLWTAVTLCVVLTPCIYVVFPKVNRARKGETVVMSRLFAGSNKTMCDTPSSNGASSPQHTNHCSAGSSTSGGNFSPKRSKNDQLEEPKIVLQQNDPPPRDLELQLLAMKDLITSMSDSSTEGRHIFKHEWQKLQSSALVLNNQLQQMEFGWEEGDDHQFQRDSTEEFTMDFSS